VQRLHRKIKSFARKQLGIPAPLVHRQILGREFIVRDGAIRIELDYDDAWLLACALHAEVVFDIGANIGYSALLSLLSESVKRILLVEANPEALSVAAENLIRNQLAARAQFVSAFAGDVNNSTVQFWTAGTGAAGSIYESHAKTGAKSKNVIEVPTVNVDYLCDLYGTIPDLLKMDVEGAEQKVLLGSRNCAGHRKTRFIVEMHSTPTMAINAAGVLEWCDSNGYRAWYLAEGTRLDSLSQIQHRGRCHLLLQPLDWPYPEWLKGIKQSAPLEDALSSARTGDDDWSM
jgi:FkbM family methyltransferase